MIVNKYQGNGGGSATSAETAEFAFIAGQSEILGGHTDAPSASDFDAASLNITAAEWSDSEPNTTRGAKKGGTRSVAGEKFFKVPADIEGLITSGVVANNQPYLVADFGYGDNASGVPNTLHIWWDFIEEGQPIGFMFAANYYCEDWDWKWIDSVDLYDENNPYEIPICGSDGLKWCLAWYSAGTYLKIWVQDSEGYVFTDAINTHNVGLWGLYIKKEDRWESVIPQMKTINGESLIGEGNITLATTDGAQGPMGIQGPQGLSGDKGDLGYQGPQGLAGGGDYIILDTLSGVTGVSGQLYSYYNKLYKWVDGAGVWGQWILGQNASDYVQYDSGQYDNLDSYLLYAVIPLTAKTKMADIYLVGDYYLSYDPSIEKFEVYDNSSLTGTPVAQIECNGTTVEVINNGRVMKFTWTYGKLQITGGGWSHIKGDGSLYSNFSIAEPHFEPLDYEYFYGINHNGTSAGIPIWNSKGLVVGKAGDINISSIRINNDEFSNTFHFFTKDGAGSWSSWYFPTQGGTQGQVLTSNGSAEPTWATMIKAVKITSAAYEALVQAGTTDPNTLYLIDDD